MVNPMFAVGAQPLARDAAYRRSFRVALAASIAVHLSLLLAVPIPRPRIGAKEASHAGFAGPTQILPELNPQDFPVEEQEQLASARREAGAIVDVPVEFEPEPTATEGIPRPIPHGAGGRNRVTVPVLELSEDWSLRSTSAPSSRSSEFVIEKMVRPSYPPEAIRNEIEGLIRIQAQVDTTGNVISVRVLDSEVDQSCKDETIRAMYLWRFRPYKVRSRPVEFSVIVPFRYRLY